MDTRITNNIDGGQQIAKRYFRLQLKTFEVTKGPASHATCRLSSLDFDQSKSRNMAS